MLWSIALQEFKQLVKTRQFVGFVVFYAALAFTAVVTDVSSVGGAGNVSFNAPVNLATFNFTQTIFAVFLIAVMLAPSVSRDFELDTWQLVFTKPVPRHSYLLGKFIGSLSAVVLCVTLAYLVQVLTIHSSFAPGNVNPFSFWDYLSQLLLLTLPNLLMMSAVLFSVSTLTRGSLYAYVFVVLLFVFYVMSTMLVSSQVFDSPPVLLDPYGAGAVKFIAQFWTPYELNTQSLTQEGLLLINRLVWVGISLGLIALTVVRFNVYPRSKSMKAKSEIDVEQESVTVRPIVTPIQDAAASWQQFALRTVFEVRSVVLSKPFLVILSIGLLKVLSSAMFREASFSFGVPPLPVSFVMVSQLVSDFSTVLMIVMIAYAGEIVWRERQVNIDEIIDATPVHNSALIFSKLIALWAVVGITLLVGALGMMVFQLVSGTPINLAVYARELGFMALPFLWISVLAVLVQTLSPNKFIGMGVVVLYLVLRLVGSEIFNLENLVVFATHPAIPISEMAPASWERIEALKYDLYWATLTIGLVVLIYWFWQRGTENRVAMRIKSGWRHKTVPQLAVLSVCLLTFVWFGRSLYLEDYVNNPVPADNDYQDGFRVRYEQVLSHLDDQPILRSKSIYLELDTYLETQQMHSRGQLVLENTSPDTAVNEVYLGMPTNTADYHMTLSGAVLKEEFPLIRHFRYELDQPMLPGETRTIAFDFKVDFSEFPGGTIPGLSSWRLKESGVSMKSYAFLPWDLIFVGFNHRGSQKTERVWSAGEGRRSGSAR